MGNFFSDRLKARRKALGLTGKELAQKVGISSPYLSQLEAGIRNAPSIEVARKLAVVLDLHVDDLLADGNIQLEVREQPAVYGCRLPEDCDLPAKLDSMQSDIEQMQRKMDAIFDLLGGALRKGFSDAPTSHRSPENNQDKKGVG